MSSSKHKRRKQTRLEDKIACGGRCPEPCGKVRYLNRELAKAACKRIPDRKMRPYNGNSAVYPSCAGFWHITSEEEYRRIVYYRDRQAFSRDHGLPPHVQVYVEKAGSGRWRYVFFVQGEEPMPSVHTYASRDAAEREAVADWNGESRSA